MTHLMIAVTTAVIIADTRFAASMASRNLNALPANWSAPFSLGLRRSEAHVGAEAMGL